MENLKVFKSKILYLIVFCSLFSFDSALAIGIGAKPSFLDLELKLGQSKEAKILVYNISQEPGIFQVSPDELNDWIKIMPDNFRLEAGENKEVEIIVLAKGGGKKATNLSVLSKPLDRRSFSVGPGLKIPLRLNVSREGSIFLAALLAVFSPDWPWLTIGISVTFLVGFFVIKYFKRRKRVIAPPENLPIETSQNNP